MLSPLDVDGVRFIAHAAPELRRYAGPIMERCALIQEQQGAEDGRRTIVDFSMYRLRQIGAAEYLVQGIDYASDDLVEDFVDDLSTALWIEAAQADVIERAGVGPQQVDFSSRLHIQRAALDALDSGGDAPMYLERVSSSDEQDSGWRLSVAGRPKRSGRRREPILAALLVEAAPHLIPFLQLPPGSVVELAGPQFLRASWVPPEVLAAHKVDLVAEKPEILQSGDGVRELLDQAGTGRGNRAAAPVDLPTVSPATPPTAPPTPSAPLPPSTPPAQRGADETPAQPGREDVPTAPSFLPIPADEPVTVEHEQDGIHLTARVAPQLQAYVRVVLDQLTRLGADALNAGESLSLAFSIYWPERIGEQAYRITTPDFSDPATFSQHRTDDLTLSAWADLTQYQVFQLTGLETVPTFVSHDVLIQQAVVDGLRSGAPVGMLVERIALSEDERYFSEGTRRSGWKITKTGEVAGDEQRLRNVAAGSLVGLLPAVVPYLGLPDDTVMHFLGDHLIRAFLIDPVLVRQAAERDPNATVGDILRSGAAARLLFAG